MPIFVAKNYDEIPIDVVLATSQELANAYWHGKGIFPHHVDVRSDSDLTNHPTGVLPIVSTEEIEAAQFGMSSRPMLVIKK